MPAKNKIIFHLSLLLSLCLSATTAYALVDYTEEESFKPQVSGASAVSNKTAAPPRQVTKTKRKAKSGPALGVSTGISYQTQDVELEGTSGKVDTMSIEAQFQTRYNVFLSAQYWQARSSSEQIISENTSFQKGNPEVVLGFNWLQFGKQSELATIDLYAGMKFGQSNSEFATERTDQIVGVSTAKRFHSLALGLGYEMRLTGDGGAEEMDIGNISKLSASLGWVVSKDIRFLVEASTFSVGRSTDEGSPLRLQEKVSFSTVKPQLQLKISPLIDLTLGAKFRSRRLTEGELIRARLWSLDSAYGNGVFTGLSFNI